MKQSLLQRFVALWPSGRPIAADCFASSVDAGNDMPIPVSLLVDVNLCGLNDEDQCRALFYESDRKLAPLARDRQIQSVLCTVGTLEEAAGRARMNAAAALWERLKGHDAATPDMLLALSIGNDDACGLEPVIGHCREIVVMLEIDRGAARLRQCVRQLHHAVGTARGDRRPSVCLILMGNTAAASALDQQCLSELARLSDSVLLMLLFDGTRGDDLERTQAYARLAAALNEAGMRRVAPCMFARHDSRSVANDTYLANLLPQLSGLDIVGLGPGAVSLFGPIRFDNRSEAGAYCDELGRGGLGFEVASRLSAVELLTVDLLCKLYGGQALAPERLCTPYDGQLPARCAASLRDELARLQQEGVLLLDGDGAWSLTPTQDYRLAEVSARLSRSLANDSDGEVVSLSPR